MAEHENSRESEPDVTDRNAEDKADAKASRDSVKAKVNGNGNGASGHAHPPVSAVAVAGHGDHGHGLAHTTPVALLVGVLAALMALTVITVLVTAVDLGAQGNLIVAMLIATVKAALVVMFFMHLVWDKKLHLLLFLTSVLFLILFLSLSVTDRGEYQRDLDTFQATQQQ